MKVKKGDLIKLYYTGDYNLIVRVERCSKDTVVSNDNRFNLEIEGNILHMEVLNPKCIGIVKSKYHHFYVFSDIKILSEDEALMEML